MEDHTDKEFAAHCCLCCTKRVVKQAYRDAEGHVFCNEAHALVRRRYIRLVKKAFDKAARYPAHEVDYRAAHFYLSHKLSEFAAAV